MKQRMVKDVVVNGRSTGPVEDRLPLLTLDGEPFPFHIDKDHGVKVQYSDASVHLVIVAIQVDRSVTVIDHAVPDGDYET